MKIKTRVTALLPGLRHIFGNLHVKHSVARKVGLGYLMVAAANGRICSYADTFAIAAHGAKILKNRETFGKFVDILTSSIDDRLDPMPYEHFATLGEIHGGTTPCPFILNPEVVTQEDWETVYAIDEKGLMPLPVTVAFCNELSVKIYGEKKACYEAVERPEARQEMKKNHLELSGMCVATLAAALNPIEGKRLDQSSSMITYDYIADEMPDAVRFGAIIQMHNDMSDLVKDMQDELATGMTAPNSLIADIAASNHLNECIGYIKEEVSKAPPGTYIPVTKLPENIQNCWSVMREQAYEIAEAMTSGITRDALNTMMSALPGPLVPARN